MNTACIAKSAPGATGMLIFSLFQAALATNAAVPQAVSPVGPTAEACPTFSWTGVPETSGYELAVFPVHPNGEVPDEPSLSAWVPAGATSWTPPANACLEAGTEYGWSIRAAGDQEVGDWSEPALIEFAVGPTFAEVESALATLDRFLKIQGTEPAGQRIDHAPQGRRLRLLRSGHFGGNSDGPDMTREGARENEPAPFKPQFAMPQPGLKSSVVQTAAMKVSGEVRTVDEAGDPRLWGKGRPGTDVYGSGRGSTCFPNDGVKFGLSLTAETWGSAAQACPAGTWVCTADDVLACDTN